MAIVLANVDSLKRSDGTEYSEKVDTSVLFNGAIRSQASLCSTGVLDVSLSNYFVCNCTGNQTFSFTNIPTDADVISLVVEFHNAGSHVLTFPSNVKWGGGSAPTFTVGASDLVGFVTTDGGVTWRGMGLNFNAAIAFKNPT